MTEYSKMKARQEEQLGSIDGVHPMTQQELNDWIKGQLGFGS